VSRKNLILTVFVCAAAVQLAVPLAMIARREQTLRHGRQYRFKTAPVDPYDAFRGRYVAINVDLSAGTATNNWGWQNSVIVTNAAEIERGDRVFALIAETTDGFARVARLTRQRPEGDGYLRARVRWINTHGKQTDVSLDLPFDRYYMNEKKAPEAEKAYREHSRRANQDAYVTVRVLSGFAVLEDLCVGGRPIRDYLGK
jgi:uncharacterized membrane-anchored protein